MPWIFMMLMLINAIFFGWKFVEGDQVQPGASRLAPQQGSMIALLSEHPELLKKVEPASAEEGAEDGAPVAPVVTAAAVRQCFNVGPFPGDTLLRQFTSVLKAKRFDARVDTRKVDEKDYWVFIPPFTNRAKAEEKLRDLKGQGVKGFVVKDGPFVNAISLNHFSRKDLADAFLTQMQGAGVVVEYREISKPAKQAWVFASNGQGGGDLRSAIDEFLESHEDVRKEIVACEE